MKAQCSNCRFYFFERRECRRYAPRDRGSEWRTTVKNDWCGEWEEGERLERTGTDYKLPPLEKLPSPKKLPPPRRREKL